MRIRMQCGWLMALCACLSWVDGAAQTPTPDAATLPGEIVTAATPDTFSLALAPDGQWLVYVANQGNAAVLWLYDLKSGSAKPMANTEGARFPFWSPDSQQIAFFADGKLKRMPVTGGIPVDVADAPSGRGGSWSRDGRILYAPSNVVGINQVMATGGATRIVSELMPGQGSHRWPQFLPGEKQFLFTAASPKPESRGVYLASLEGAAPIRILPGETAAYYVNGNLLYALPDGKLVTQRFDLASAKLSGEPTLLAGSVGTDGIVGVSAFTFAGNGMVIYRPGAGPDLRQYAWLDRRGHTLALTGKPDAASPGNPDLAPNGQFIAMSRTIQSNADIWLMNVASGELQPLTTASSFELEPLWSPDSKRVVFRSNRNGHYDLFEKTVGDTEERPFLVSDQDKGALDWSRDGKLILFATQNAKVASELWALPTKPGAAPYPLVQGDADNVQGQFSPDGKWLAYSSNQTGRYEVYVKSLNDPHAMPVQITTEGGLYPRWNRQGGELFYLTRDNQVMSVPLKIKGKQVTAAPPTRLFAAVIPTGRNQGFGGYNSRATYIAAPDGKFLILTSAEAKAAQPPLRVLNGRLLSAP